MTDNNQTNNQGSNQGGTTMADRATELKDRASGLFQSGVDAVKSNPGTAAAVVGGVAAAAAAYVNRDKIAETAGSLRDKVSSSGKQDSGKKG